MDVHRQSGLWRNGMAPSANAAADNAPDLDSSPVSPRAASGPYQYYQPPPPRSTTTGEAVKRSFSERAPALDESPVIGHGGIFRADSKKDPAAAIAAAKLLSEGIQQPPVRDTLAAQPAATSAQLAQTKHVADDGEGPPALHIDPDYVPDNLRASAWSPDMMSPRTTTTASKPQSQTKPRQGSIPTSAAEGPRRSSVPDRSPLQNLESWSKEEKRARIEQAEKRARQRSLSGQGGEGGAASGRIASEGTARKPSRRERDERRPRLASEGASPREDEYAARRPQKANNAVKTSKVPAQEVSSPKMRRAQLVENGSSSDNRGADSGRASLDLGRNHSRHYRQGSRESGAMDPAAQEAAAERGKAAYERRKSLMQDNLPSPTSPVSPVTPDGGGYGQTFGVSDARPPAQRPSGDYARAKQPLQTGGVSRSVSKSTRSGAAPALTPDAASGPGVLNTANDAVKYAVPPQAPAARAAREQVGFDSKPLPPIDANADKKHHRFGDFLHHGSHRDHRSYTESSKPLEDWRKAGVARLTTEDLDFEATVSGAVAAALAANKETKDATWWEKGHSRRTSSASASASAATKNIPDLNQYDGPYEEKANGFQPRLFLKCGPLLRYTGIRTETAPAVAPSRQSRASAAPPASKEVWHGTIMIVTQDDKSDLTRTPSLRLFAQPMTLHNPAPHTAGADSEAVLPEVEDPVAGTVKLSRTGRALYVRPVHDIEPGVDLSREESNYGLYAATRTPILGPQASTGPDGRQSQHITFQDKNRVQNRDGEKARRYREVKATKLHSEQGCTFWRFAVAIELTDTQHRIAYRINKGPAVAFWVPARGETMNIMFHSCNGFSYSVDSNNFCGPDPLWRDVLNRHQHRPFHVMIGGGDQIYNDAAMHETTLFKDWLRIKNPEHKHNADFTMEMQRELEAFYLNRYSMWFSQGLFGAATSQIPMVNIWDDHDIIDGYGSYPDSSMSTRVFTGLGAVAFKYYMLFQHQSLTSETEKEEPSWVLGEHPGPYINQVSRSLFLRLGSKVAFLGLDCRTERKRDEILCQETYDIVFDRCRAEIGKDSPIKHLIVLLGVPIAYPRLNFLENILTSRVMDPVKALRRAGLLGNFVNKIDGGVEILDDLDDHWTAKHHKAERNWFVQELQELAAEKSVRITILGGDVHLAAVGQFYSNKKLGIRKDRDHRYMPNVISSAIVNTPPPNMMADVLNQRNKVHHLDEETDEDLIPMFEHDVDGSRRGNRHLLPRRNFCMIREWVPGSTPPPSPKLKPASTAPLPTTEGSLGVGTPDDGEWGGKRDRRFPPGSMRRTMSLSRVPNLVRRLSGASKRRPNISGPIPQDYQQQQEQAMQRANSFSGPGLDGRRSASFTAGDDERPMFLRRPTNLSEKEVRKAVAKGGANAEFDAHIDLQDGLDISLCMEIDQHDPAGTTMPYRLLVPALRYEGPGDLNTAAFQSHRRSFMDRLRGFRVRETPKNPEDYEESFLGDDGELQSVRLNSRTSSPFTPTTANTIANTGRNSAAAGLGLTTTGRGAPSSRLAMGDGYDDTDDGYDDHTGGAAPAATTQAYTSQHSYNKGLNLSLPPIGATATTAAPSHSMAAPTHNPTAAPPTSSYPQSGYRRAQQQPQPPAATATRSEEPRRYSYDEDDRSFTTEQYYDDDFDQVPAAAQQRRPPQPAAVPRTQQPYFGSEDAGLPPAGNAPGGGGGGGFFRKLSLQHDRRSAEGGRPSFSSAGGAALGREGSVQKKGWKKLWKQPRGDE